MVTLDLGKEDCERPQINHCERPQINHIPTRTRTNSEEMVDTERTVHRRYNRHDITSPITKLRDVAWDQSDHRNSVLHDSENYVTREQAERMELQIRREKETGPQTLPDQDRGLFAGTLESLLSRDFE